MVSYGVNVSRQWRVAFHVSTPFCAMFKILRKGSFSLPMLKRLMLVLPMMLMMLETSLICHKAPKGTSLPRNAKRRCSAWHGALQGPWCPNMTNPNGNGWETHDVFPKHCIVPKAHGRLCAVFQLYTPDVDLHSISCRVMGLESG